MAHNSFLGAECCKFCPAQVGLDLLWARAMRQLEQNCDLRQLEEVFEQFPSVEIVFLFGSMAEGRERRDSDLDLAIEGDPEKLEDRKTEMLTELARRGFSRVDLIFLRRVPPALAHEAVKHNQVVYSVRNASIGTVFSRIVRKYLDIRPFLCVQAEAYKERTLDD